MCPDLPARESEGAEQQLVGLFDLTFLNRLIDFVGLFAAKLSHSDDLSKLFVILKLPQKQNLYIEYARLQRLSIHLLTINFKF